MPRSWLVPERVMTLTTPPEAWPYSALKPLTSTWISWIESSAGLWCAKPGDLVAVVDAVDVAGVRAAARAAEAIRIVVRGGARHEPEGVV